MKNISLHWLQGIFETVPNTLPPTLAGKGDLFGTDLGFSESIVKSSCDVKSLTYCDLQCIMLKGLMETLSMYPEYAETFANDIVHDLTYNLREGYEETEVGPKDLALPSSHNESLRIIQARIQGCFGVLGPPPPSLRLSAIFFVYSNPQMLIFPCPLNFIWRSIVTLRRSNAT